MNIVTGNRFQMDQKEISRDVKFGNVGGHSWW
jgi:hypothetical protein